MELKSIPACLIVVGLCSVLVFVLLAALLDLVVSWSPFSISQRALSTRIATGEATFTHHETTNGPYAMCTVDFDVPGLESANQIDGALAASDDGEDAWYTIETDDHYRDLKQLAWGMRNGKPSATVQYWHHKASGKCRLVAFYKAL